MHPLHVDAIIVVVLLMPALPRPTVRFLAALFQVDVEMGAVVAAVKGNSRLPKVLPGDLHLCVPIKRLMSDFRGSIQ